MSPSSENRLPAIEPFLSKALSASLAAGISEASRKGQLFNQVELHLHAQRQHGRRAELLAYARQNYTETAVATVKE